MSISDLRLRAVQSTAKAKADEGEPLPIEFDHFAITESSDDMEEQMLRDVFVLGRMAIMGQSTIFYGGPNVGKTLIGLKLLIEAIQEKRINAEDVYYINADDTYKGLVIKRRLAEEYGFKVLVPGRNGFKADMLLEIFRSKCATDTAHGCIVVLDTLKKFTNLMNKDASSAFSDVQRNFVLSGGTTIGYAHVNKSKDEDGKSIHAGTTDIIDDGDCCYILDELEDDGRFKTVQFRNKKDRGDVAQLVSYRYKSKKEDSSVPYLELLYSVGEVSPEIAAEAAARALINDAVEENDLVIKAVIASITGGMLGKTEIVDDVYASTDHSRAEINKVLRQHTGTDKLKGHRWNTVKGERNYPDYIVL